MNRFQKNLAQLKEHSRHRRLFLPQGIDLSSNDYLGFADHPFLIGAAQEALDNGLALGAGGSRLLRGHTRAHESLEAYAAQFFGSAAALYFSSGYQANSAIFSTLPARHDVIIFDELIHASARESIQHASARHVKVRHNDLNAYEDALKAARDKAPCVWVAVESLYSMDGDMAPLAGLYELAKKYDAFLIVDEAHATGVYGDSGQGLCDHHAHENLITLHTGGKALGMAGGLVCGPRVMIDYMINKARPFIYSTAPPPFQAHMLEQALRLCASDDDHKYAGVSGHTRRQMLRSLIRHAKADSQIIPLIMGDDRRAVEVAAALQEAGFDIRAIRPPTVPAGTARLRLSLNARLNPETLDRFFEAFHALCPERISAA